MIKLDALEIVNAWKINPDQWNHVPRKRLAISTQALASSSNASGIERVYYAHAWKSREVPIRRIHDGAVFDGQCGQMPIHDQRPQRLSGPKHHTQDTEMPLPGR